MGVFLAFNMKYQDISLSLVNELFKSFQNKTTKEIELIKSDSIKPSHETNQSIILILGESHRAKEFMDIDINFFNKNYKTIYAAATNTDVSLPLFLMV